MLSDVREEPVLKLELVCGGLSFPTSVAFDSTGDVYVAESGLGFGGAAPHAAVWRLDRQGGRELFADGFRAPINGLSYHGGNFYVSEGGEPGRITRLQADGTRATVLDGLPGPGNYHTNMAVVGPDEWLYFSQGAMTNSGVVGLDAFELGWLRRLPHAHDIPGFPIVLEGTNFESDDPIRGDAARAVTGAFSPFGTLTVPGQPVAPGLPCTAAVMRCRTDGRNLELVAWGLRNAYGLGFLGDGRLLAIDQGADDRGSRPIGGCPDTLYEVVRGAWYGWPDYVAGEPVTSSMYQPERGPSPTFLLRRHDNLPAIPTPLYSFAPHAAATKFASDGPRLHVALFGDERPMTAPEGPRVGRAVVTLDMRGWSCSELVTAPLKRPIDVALNARDEKLYVVDFGDFEMLAEGRLRAGLGTGALWRLN